MSRLNVSLNVGMYRVPVTVDVRGDRCYVYSGYNKDLVDEIKALAGRKWHGFDDENPEKVWSFPATPRNWFRFSFLSRDKNDPFGPYRKWKEPLKPIKFDRPLAEHQVELATAFIQRNEIIAAYEMGTGKTLPIGDAIEKVAREHSIADEDIWWVGTKGSLLSTELEFVKWGFAFKPRLLTYDRLRIMHGDGFKSIPRVIVFDECSKLKSTAAQRTQAALDLTDKMRSIGKPVWIAGLTGSPAPKSPIDWWSQCEVVRPGYLREADVTALTNRLAVIEYKESEAGASFPTIKTWRDSEDICAFEKKDVVGKNDKGKDIVRVTYCCAPKAEHGLLRCVSDHVFVPGVNEVSKLNRRMSGLVMVKFAKECLDLPEMRQEICLLPPSTQTMQLARLIVARTSRAVTARGRLKELSDGFQYSEIATGKKLVCPDCKGTLKITTMDTDDFGNPIPDKMIVADCVNCEGGLVEEMTRSPTFIGSPKLDRLVLDLEQNEEIGRVAIYADFTASIDMIVTKCQEAGWNVLRFDGRGQVGFAADGSQISLPPVELLKMFMDTKADNKFAFVGHPGAAGMGLNLTAARMLIWYGLPDAGESYVQARKRIHRWGMDVQRGVIEKFYYHLATDKLIHTSLNGKIRLQDISMGDLSKALEEQENDR